jgi:hypothetical protein
VSYFPLDRDILSSSLWANGTPEAFKVWSYLLLTADPRTGCVADADPAIALHCGLSLEATTAALEWLMGPDPHSRTKDHGGARIARLPDGGFLLLNYLRHQAKDYSTPRVQAFRERQAAAARAAREETPGGNDETRFRNAGNDGHGHGHGPNERTTEGAQGASGGGGNGSRNGAGASTARELRALEADAALVDVADAWVKAFRRPRRELGVLRAAKTALAGGYASDAVKLVVRVVALAREAPERFPDRGSIRWAVEHSKAGDPGYLLRPATLDRLIPEAEAWDRA